MHARRARRVVVALASVLAATGAMVAVPIIATTASAAADTNTWSATGTAGTTTVLDNGAGDGNPSFSYFYCPPGGSTSQACAQEAGAGASATFTFEATDTSGASTVSGTFVWNGFHSFFQVTTALDAFVTTPGGTTTTPIPSATAGPESCCTAPSGGFSYNGQYEFSGLAQGDKYGFTLAGSNFDSDAQLGGSFAFVTGTWQVPVAPSGLTAGFNTSPAAPANQLDLGWNIGNPSTTNGPSTGYQVLIGTSAGSEAVDPHAVVDVAHHSATLTQLADGTSLNPGGTYYVEVEATNPGGASAASNEVVVNPGAPNPPGPPTSLNAMPGVGNVALTWNAPGVSDSHGGATGYAILVGPSSGNEQVDTNVTVDVATQTATVNALPDGSALLAGSTYYFEVEATNGAGKSGPSNEASTVPGGFGPNTAWFTAQAIAPPSGSNSPNWTNSTSQSIDEQGEALWYDFPVAADQQVQVCLANVPADYNLAVFDDIATNFQNESSSTNLAQLGAQSGAADAASAFSASAFSASAFSASAFSASAFSASAFSASAFSASAFSASAFSASAFSPTNSSASAFSASAFSASAFSASAFSADYANAQIESVLGVSTISGPVDKCVTVNSWNNSGNFYARVTGNNGAFAPLQAYTLTVSTSGSNCPLSLSPNPTSIPAANLYDTATPGVSFGGNSPGGAPYQTVIVANSAAMPQAGASYQGNDALYPSLETLAQNTGGTIVDVAQSPWVGALETQANANPSCPQAENYVADAIESIVNQYRTTSNNLRYVVIVGDDGVIPFFRYPDEAGVASESEYNPPLSTTSPEGAALASNEYLSDDQYGAATTLSYEGMPVPLPTAAVGRLVETPTEILATLTSYNNGRNTINPTSSLSTGYDFMAAPAQSVAGAFAQYDPSGTNTSFITNDGVAPSQTGLPPTNSWTATGLENVLFGSHHDVLFLGGHYSANNLLAADETSTLLTNQFAQQVGSTLNGSLVLAAGCHAGYSIVPGAAVSGVTDPLSWPEAFSQAGATLIAGTGYQYGDTNYTAYSDQIYVEIAQQLGYTPVSGYAAPGTASGVAVGNALVDAEQQYLAGLDALNPLEEKALLEINLFGLPMIGVVEPHQIVAPDPSSTVNATAVTSGPGSQLGLEAGDLNETPANKTTMITPVGSSSSYTYDQSDQQNIVADPGGPVLPLDLYDVNVSGQTLRGVGLWSASYTDTSGTSPLTGDPAVETGNPSVAPFASPVFFPETLWNPNYFATLLNGGDTQLAVTPEQYVSDPGSSTTNTRRSYNSLDFKLFYDNNTHSYTANDKSTNKPYLAAPPNISNVTSTVNGQQVTVTATVTGDPSAGIQDAWVTFTGDNPGDPLYGSWSSVDLTQSSTNSTQWSGTFTDPSGNPASNAVFIVQAVNGVGETTVDDNAGAYFTPTFTPGASPAAGANTYTLTLGGATSGTYQGGSAQVTATLTSAAGDSSPEVSGQTITFAVGPDTVSATTSSGGVATAALPLVLPPGSYPLSASFVGDANNLGAGASGTFTIQQPTTSLSVSVPSTLTVGVQPTGQSSNEVTATLTSPAGGGGSPLVDQPVFFDLYAGTQLVGTSVGYTQSNGVAVAQPFFPPAGDVGSGFSVTAYFGESAVPGPGSSTLNETNPAYAGSTATSVGFNISDPNPTITITAPSTVTATGFTTPVSYTATATNYGGSAGKPTCDGQTGTSFQESFPPGNNTITCTEADSVGDSTMKTATVDVQPAPLTISYSGTQTYGGTPSWSYTGSGYVKGDSDSTLGSANNLSCTSTGTSSSPVGSYQITGCSGLNVPSYYAVTPQYGSLTVTPAPLTITASSATMTYGSTPPVISPSFNRLVNGDTAASLGAQLSCSSSVTSSSPVGQYSTACTGASDSNYTITYEPGVVDVSPAPLTITASSAAVTYGNAPGVINASYSGFVNHDGPGNLASLPSCSTTATAQSPAGTYPSSCSGAVDPNYAISYVPGSVVVGQGMLVISASSGSMTYGAAPPSVTATYSGFVNGDSASSLSSKPTCTTAATSSSAVGSYVTSCSGAVDPNYSITYVGGSTTVMPAPLLITAASASMTYGSTPPAVTPSFSGFVNGDTAGKLTKQPTCTTSVTSSSMVGGYATTCSGAVDANYTISYSGGTITVDPAPLTVTASSGTVTYGQAPPKITANYAGFQNNDTPASLSTPPACSTTATSSSPLGVYPTSCSGAVDPNYSFSYVNGTVTVGPSTVILLGNGTGMLSVTGQSSFNVNGNLAVNSSSSGSVSLSGQSRVKATGSLLSPVTNPVSSSGQSTTSFASVQKLAAESDPDAALPAPSTSGLTVYSTSTIQGPGVYTKAVSISGQSKVKLASGTYVFDSGLTMSGQSTVTNATGGVFLYFAGGSLTISGQSSATLTPLTTGTYQGIVLYQARGDSQALSLGGQSNATSLAGLVYVPAAAADISGQSGLSIAALIASSAVVSGQGSAAIG